MSLAGGSWCGGVWRSATECYENRDKNITGWGTLENWSNQRDININWMTPILCAFDILEGQKVVWCDQNGMGSNLDLVFF